MTTNYAQKLRLQDTETVKAGALNFGHMKYWLAVDQANVILRARIVTISHSPFDYGITEPANFIRVTVVLPGPNERAEPQYVSFDYLPHQDVHLILPNTDSSDLDRPVGD